MILNFEKWQGCLNDFVIIWSTVNEAKYLVSSLQRQIHKVCARDGSGVGADGILVLLQEDKSDLKPKELVIINSDGSLAKNCGNGLRCAAASIYQRNRDSLRAAEELREISISVDGHSYLCTLLKASKSCQNINFAVSMGTPLLNEMNSWHEKSLVCFEELKNSEELINKDCQIFSCEIANPHLVFLDQDCDQETIVKLGQSLQKDPLEDGVNVHIAKALDADSKLRLEAKKNISGELNEVYEAMTWERGAELTQACGSGACAIAASILSEGFVSSKEWIAIKMPGGFLYCKQSDPDEPMLLAGPASFVFKGEIDF